MEDVVDDSGDILLSAIIPTVGRDSLTAAIISAQAQQGVGAVEVVVVVDGDESARLEVEELVPAGVVLACTGSRSNANVARNVGVKIARGKYVAFLDDDDLWAPGKAAAQISVDGSYADGDSRLIVSAVKATSGSTGAGPFKVWPTRPYVSGESIAEFLFVRESVRGSAKVLQSSTWLALRSVFLRFPFDEEVPMHQDFDWLVRWAGEVDLVYVDEALASYTLSQGAVQSVTSRSRTLDSLRWAVDRRELLGERAFGDFCFTISSVFARRSGSYRELFSAFLTGSRGRPSMRAIAVLIFRVAEVSKMKIDAARGRVFELCRRMGGRG